MNLGAISSDGLDAPTMQYLHRSNSTSSDVMSTANSVASSATAHTAPAANPPPAYIAQNEASDLISAELERKVILTSTALVSLNDFLDAVLYSILTTAHSIALGNLKAAVSVVLRPRLGKAALKVAEEELKEYMEDGEEEELSRTRSITQSGINFDTELVWKLTRLRCMVYARMGDLEEEDEEEWLEREHLLEQVAAARKAGKTNIEVGPAAAIFLTAVIEYLAEQALYYAAQHAQRRHESSRKRDSAFLTGDSQLNTPDSDLVLDARDMNQVGRDSPLSRLWRSWRRGARNLLDIDTFPVSSEDLPSPTTRIPHRRSASANITPTIGTIEEERRISQVSTVGPMIGAVVPGTVAALGTSRGPKSSQRPDVPSYNAHRPVSLPAMPLNERYNLVVPTTGPQFQERSPLRPKWDRRSSSLPNSQATSPVIEHESYFRRAIPPPPLTQVHTLVTTGSPEQLPIGSLVPVTHEELSNQAVMPVDRAQDDPQQATLLRSTSVAGEGAESTFKSSQDAASIEQAPASAQGSRLISSNTEHARNDGSPVASKSHVDASVAREASLARPASESEGMGIEDTAKPAAQHSASAAPTAQPNKGNSNGLRQRENLPPAQDIRTASPVQSDRSGSFVSNPTFRQLEAAPLQHPPVRPASIRSIPDARSSSSGRVPGPLQDGFVSPVPTSQMAPSSRGSMVSESQGGSANGQSPVNSSFNDTTAKVNRSPFALSRSSPQSSYERIRVSEDELVPVVSHEQNKRNLEVLIKSNETLHYTLTPAPVAFRPEDLAASSKRSQTQDLADFFRSTGPPSQEQLRPKTARSAKRSVDPSPGGPSPRAKLPSRVALSASSTLTSRKRNPLGEPRDAKVGRDRSIRDLADYMRSTGPSSEDQLPSVVGGVRSASRNTQHNAGGWVAPSPGHPPARPSSVPRKNTPSPKPVNRLKFQARDARPSRRAESSALIEFIREGPPSGYGAGNDEAGGFVTYTDAHPSLNGVSKSSSSTTGVPSVDTTTSSQAPLLRDSYGTGNSGQSPGPHSFRQPPAVGTSTSTNAHSGMPTRTRRRVRDPYAIDISDDELEAPPVRRRERDEESLMDFLRNTAPDSETVEVAPSSDEMGGRGRSTQPRSTGPSQARASSPHLTKAGSKLDSYRPTQVTHASHVDRNRRKHTPSLDDDSAPEPQINRYRAVPIGKGDGGLKKFFSMRGKAR